MKMDKTDIRIILTLVIVWGFTILYFALVDFTGVK